MKKYTLLYIFCIITFSSCEKVIDIKVSDFKKQLVIQAEITDGAGPFFVHLSNSYGLNDASKNDTIDNASIYIWDNKDQFDTLLKVNQSTYKTNKLKGIPGRSYFIKVMIGSQVYLANNTMPKKVYLDDMARDTIAFNGNKIFSIVPVFLDPIELGNNYRFIQKVNDTVDKTYYLVNDHFNNGAINKTPLVSFYPNIKIRQNDKIEIEMQCIEEKEYNYFYILSQQSNFGANGNVSPSNPPTNFSGNVLGYFSTHTSQKMALFY